MDIRRNIISLISSILVLSLTFTGCIDNSNKDVFNEKIRNDSKVLSSEVGKNPNNLNIESIMEQLTCEEYLSRVIGTDENTKTSEFIKNYFEAIGLKSLNNDSYYQEVDLTKEMRNIFNPNGENNNKVNNVLGVIKGKDSSKAIVISAHLDHITIRKRLEDTNSNNNSKEISISKIQGAVDNASGVSVLLESSKDLAKHYKNKKPPYDIIFAAFNAEEVGLVGSSKFVSEFKKSYDDWYNINIDCIGIKGNKGLALKDTNEICEELYSDFIEVLEKDKVKYDMVPYAMNKDGFIVGSSDHMSFRRNNDASLVIGQDGIVGVVHSEDDNMSIIDFELIEDIKNALVDFIIETEGKIY